MHDAQLELHRPWLTRMDSSQVMLMMALEVLPLTLLLFPAAQGAITASLKMYSQVLRPRVGAGCVGKGGGLLSPVPWRCAPLPGAAAIRASPLGTCGSAHCGSALWVSTVGRQNGQALRNPAAQERDPSHPMLLSTNLLPLPPQPPLKPTRPATLHLRLPIPLPPPLPTPHPPPPRTEGATWLWHYMHSAGV